MDRKDTGWKDISSAPKSTRVLVFNGSDIRTAMWWPPYTQWAWSDGYGHCQPSPTHWRPLPSPPKETDNG